MDTKLSEQIQVTIDALELAHTRAVVVMQTMRKQRVTFSLDYNHADDDIALLTSKMRILKQLAQRVSRSGGRAHPDTRREHPEPI